MDKRGLSLPTVEFVQRKARKLEEVKNISLKEEDVEKVSYIIIPSQNLVL